MTVAINTALQNQQVDAVGVDLDNGFIDIYDGSQPSPNDPPSGILLVSIPLGTDAYNTAAAGSASIPANVSGTAVATGTAGYAQQRNSANTRWMYGSVSEIGSGGDVQLDTVNIEADEVVTITNSVLTQPVSA